MFSSLRNYSKNIDKCERFYYDNFDYYNICEDIEKDYKDDLSKLFFHSNRRSTPIIATYGTSQRFQHSRDLRHENEEKRTMEDFINDFIDVYMENNYSPTTKFYEKEPCVEPFQLVHLSKVSSSKYTSEFCPFKTILLSKEELSECLQELIEASGTRVQKLEEDYANIEKYAENEETGILKLSNVEFHFAMELYLHRILTQHYFENIESLSFMLLYEFLVEVHRLMWEVLNSRMRTILLMAQPKTPFINMIMHPLVLPITTFLKYDHKNLNEQSETEMLNLYKSVAGAEEEKPRIVFLNLDGKESSHNLRNLATLGKSLLYISIFNEPTWLEKKEVSLKHMFDSDEENFTPSYENYWRIYSEAIINEFKVGGEKSNSKFLLFPLNSHYLKRKYTDKYFTEKSNFQQKDQKLPKMPKLETSQDIFSLFEQIIYEEIRMFRPTMIFISYNGTINISENHFADIIRNCSIIADHRVILFPNFTHYFEEEEFHIDEEEDNIEKQLCVHEFYQHYFEYKIENINQERLWTNLSLFLKYGPGTYSMEDRIHSQPSDKYTIGTFYLYLEALVQMDEFRGMEKYQIRKWSSNELSSLFSNYQNWEIKENKKENKHYEKILSTVVSQFLCKNINEEKLISIIGKRMYYRLQLIAEEILKDEEETRKYLVNLDEGPIKDEMNEESKEVTNKRLKQSLLQEYLETEKERLLSENLENYKTKKFFYLGEAQKSFGSVSCFKFYLSGVEESEEIYIEKYSQVIVNEEYEEIFILNYKGPDNRHMILYGSIKNTQIEKDIMMVEVKETDFEMTQEINEYLNLHEINEDGVANQKQDLVFVQYNYCIHDRTLYLFWPLLWNLKEEARCKLLGLEYRPKRIQKMIKVFQFQNEAQLRYENIAYEPCEKGAEVVPRWGTSCLSLNDNCFRIFGGIFDNENDFKMIGSGVYYADIKENGKGKCFTIRAMPKTKNNGDIATCLKPKINYSIKPTDNHIEENCLKIYGGYGREGTGFWNLFSYDEYDLNGESRVTLSNEAKFIRRVVHTERQLEIDRIGKYNVIINNYNVSQIEEKFSDAPKEKFIFEKGTEGSGKINEWEILAFIDDSIRINEFKVDPKKLFLFGFDRTVREKIYVKFWSPEMYIIDGIKEFIINLSLKTEKGSNFLAANYLIPREDDIMSMCLEEDRLYLLSNSHVTHSLDKVGSRFTLYEGSLAAVSEVIRKKELQMIAKYQFDEKNEKFLNLKTIFIHDEKIYLVGGLCVQQENLSDNRHEREDYILEVNKGRFKIKTRKIELSLTKLDMPNCVAVKENDSYLLYSIAFEEISLNANQTEGIEWKVKIEKHTFEPSESNCLLMGSFCVYAYNKENPNKLQKYFHSYLEDPKFVKIEPYTRFSFTIIREVVSKIIWRISKNEYLEKKTNSLEIIKAINRETNDSETEKLLQNNWKCFEDLITVLRTRSETGYEMSFDEEELLKDLKHAYYLVSKMIIQNQMHLGEPQPNEYLFIVEDKSSKKVKYLGVGPLNSTKINFFRIRFKNELLINLNQQADNSIFYHPISNSYYSFDYESLKIGESSEYTNADILKPLSIIIKQ